MTAVDSTPSGPRKVRVATGFFASLVERGWCFAADRSTAEAEHAASTDTTANAAIASATQPTTALGVRPIGCARTDEKVVGLTTSAAAPFLRDRSSGESTAHGRGPADLVADGAMDSR